MEDDKKLALAMRAGAFALRKLIDREGCSSKYVLDPFNECGMRSEIWYHEAAEILCQEGNTLLNDSKKE